MGRGGVPLRLAVLPHLQVHLRRLDCRIQGYLAHENCPPIGPYSRTMPRVLWRSWGVAEFLMSEVPLYVGRGGVPLRLAVLPQPTPPQNRPLIVFYD